MSQISVSNPQSTTLFLFGLLLFYYLNIPLLKKIIKEITTEKTSAFSKSFNILFNILQFQTSNDNISFQNIISLLHNRMPIISHVHNTPVYIKLLNIKNNIYFQAINTKPDGECLFINQNNVYYGDYEYNLKSIYDIYKFEKNEIKLNYPTNQIFILIKNPQIYEDTFSIINKDSEEGRSEYLYVLVNNKYKKFNFPLHLWDRLEKLSKGKNNIIKILYNYASFNDNLSEFFPDYIYNSLYTSNLKNKFILISNQIAISNGENNIQSIIKIAKNIFKLNCSEEEVLNILSFNFNKSNKKQNQFTQNIIDEKQVQFTQNLIDEQQNAIVEKKAQINQDAIDGKQTQFTQNIIDAKKGQYTQDTIDDKQKTIDEKQAQFIQNIIDEKPAQFTQNIIDTKQGQYTQDTIDENQNQFTQDTINKKQYSIDKIQDNYIEEKKIFIPKDAIILPSFKLSQSMLKATIICLLKKYINELEKLKNIEKFKLNKKFKDLIKDQVIEEKKNYKYDIEFLKTYNGLEILPKYFLNNKRHANIDKLKTINEFEIIYLLYKKYLNISNKTDNDIYQLNICIDYIQKNINLIIKCIENIDYIPFKKWNI